MDGKAGNTEELSAFVRAPRASQAASALCAPAFALPKTLTATARALPRAAGAAAAVADGARPPARARAARRASHARPLSVCACAAQHSRFDSMSGTILGRIDELGVQLDALERAVSDLAVAVRGARANAEIGAALTLRGAQAEAHGAPAADAAQR